MKHSEWKETVRLALLCAIEKRKGGEIARDIIISRSTVHTFAKQGVCGPDTVQAIAHWLTRHGYLEGPASSIRPDHPPEEKAIDAMAKDLEALATLLHSPVSNDVKARAFAERVTFWYKSMQEYIKQIREQKDKEGK
ncbi:MAG: hypothetical protein GXY07_08115 [Candidatus Hydrogenedentes bacterium]|nr:hypothetical protein [Candidatus Hydrogenedentota bacterium]